MEYAIEWEDGAAREMRKLPAKEQHQIGSKIELLRHDLHGDITKLGGEKQKYRLRAGRYRVLFKLEGNRVVIYRIRIRGDAYSQFLW